VPTDRGLDALVKCRVRRERGVRVLAEHRDARPDPVDDREHLLGGGTSRRASLARSISVSQSWHTAWIDPSERIPASPLIVWMMRRIRASCPGVLLAGVDGDRRRLQLAQGRGARRHPGAEACSMSMSDAGGVEGPPRNDGGTTDAGSQPAAAASANLLRVLDGLPDPGECGVGVLGGAEHDRLDASAAWRQAEARVRCSGPAIEAARSVSSSWRRTSARQGRWCPGTRPRGQGPRLGCSVTRLFTPIFK
jgi:hypothetical protein